MQAGTRIAGITPPAFARATMDTTAFDATQEYCTNDTWQHPSCFSQWTHFTAESNSFSSGEHFVAAEKSRLFRGHQTLPRLMRVSHPRLHKLYGR